MQLILMTALLAGFAVANAQQEDCFSPAVMSAFAQSLTDGSNCIDRIFRQTETSLQDLDYACTAECAGAISEWLASSTCNLPDVAEQLRFFCLPTNDPQTVIKRCRYAFVDDTLFNNTNIDACAGFSADTMQCPTGCADGLSAVVSTIGCCYQHAFDTNFLNGAELYTTPPLWNACNVDIPNRCMGDPFPVTATEEVPEGAERICAVLSIMMMGLLVSMLL